MRRGGKFYRWQEICKFPVYFIRFSQYNRDNEFEERGTGSQTGRRGGKDAIMISIKDTILEGKKHIHFIGIGGSGMYPIVQILHGLGFTMSGSDNNPGETIEAERALGIPVTIGQKAENIAGADLIVHTAAIMEDNPELVAARQSGVPTIERMVLLGLISRWFEDCICVCGTHGKTTTTSMCTHIFMAAEADPTVMIGGTLPLLHAGYRVGQGDTIILESCEYCNSFLSFFPTVAVILNVEEDHLDFFKDLADIQHSFRRFAELVPPAGSVIVNADNASAMEAVTGLEHPIFTFGLDHAADCTAANLTEVDGRPVFDVMIRGEKYARVELHVYGHHNVLNALAAASAAWALGLPGHAVETGLASFTGAGRRFEHKGTYHGAEVYDDYAHHPDELHALFTTAKEMGYERLVVAFQPHTYSRTAKLFERFVEELKIPDVAILAEIFAAREQNTLGISSADLCRNIPGAVYCSTLDKAAAALRQAARPGDLILTVGAGDIYRAGEKLLAGV